MAIVRPDQGSGGGGGGGAISVTDGIHTVNPATSIDFTGAVAVTDAGGGQAVVAPPKIGCRVYNSANITVPDSTPTVMTFDNERYDYGGMHSTIVNTGRLTAPVKGVYAFTSALAMASGALPLNADGRLRLNGTTLIGLIGAFGEVAGHAAYMTPAEQYELDIGDYVELLVAQGSGADATVFGNGTAPNYSLEFAAAMLFAT